jgi:hypothetical protein
VTIAPNLLTIYSSLGLRQIGVLQESEEVLRKWLNCAHFHGSLNKVICKHLTEKYLREPLLGFLRNNAERIMSGLDLMPKPSRSSSRRIIWIWHGDVLNLSGQTKLLACMNHLLEVFNISPSKLIKLKQ